MKSIKFCRKYQNKSNADVKITLEKFGFLLERSIYIFKIKENFLTFKAFYNSASSTPFAKDKGGVILRSGKIIVSFKDNILKVCWKIPILTIWIRAFMFGFLFSLTNYYFSQEPDIYKSAIIFGSVFALTIAISFIVLFVKVYEIHGSVFYKD